MGGPIFRRPPKVFPCTPLLGGGILWVRTRTGRGPLRLPVKSMSTSLPTDRDPPLGRFSRRSSIPRISILRRVSLFLRILLRVSPRVLSRRSRGYVRVSLPSSLRRVEGMLLRHLLPPTCRASVPRLLSLSCAMGIRESSLLLPRQRGLCFCL